MPRTSSPTEGDIHAQGLGIDLGHVVELSGDGDRSVKHKTSGRSMRSQTQDETPVSSEQAARRGSVASAAPMQPIVESPTTDRTTVVTPSNSDADHGAFLSARPQADPDAVSIHSTNTSGGTKKKPWRRGSTKQQQQRGLSGLASAIAASGLAMANPGLTMQNPPVPQQYNQNGAARSQSPPKQPPERTNSSHSVIPQPRSRQTSASYASTHSGGDEGGDFDSEMSSSEDELDLNEDDIPVTGFAVASSKRNFDFHDLFPAIPEGDYLIEGAYLVQSIVEAC